MKVSEVLARLVAEGWVLVTQRGSHRQYKHPVISGRVTVAGSQVTIWRQELNSIFKQAGWKK